MAYSACIIFIMLNHKPLYLRCFAPHYQLLWIACNSQWGKNALISVINREIFQIIITIKSAFNNKSVPKITMPQLE